MLQTSPAENLCNTRLDGERKIRNMSLESVREGHGRTLYPPEDAIKLEHLNSEQILALFFVL